MLGAMQDITEREQTEKQILKKKELSIQIINSLPGVFLFIYKEGNFALEPEPGIGDGLFS